MSLEKLLFQLREQAARLSSSNEEAAKQAAVIPILGALGWDTSNSIEEVCPEYPVGTYRVDYCLKIAGRPRAFVEAKRPGENLENHQEQLLGYSYEEGVELAVLTNGLSWWLYLPMRTVKKAERRFATIEVTRTHNAASMLMAFLSRDAIRDGSAIRSAESEIVRNIIPSAWAELCHELRRSLADQLANKVKTLSGYEPDRARLEDFLDKQSGAHSEICEQEKEGNTLVETGNPFRPGSRFGKIYDALLKGIPRQPGLEGLARQLGIDPGNARRVFQRGHGGMRDQGHWYLTVEGDIEKLIPEVTAPSPEKAQRVLEILRDGQWHSAPDLREKLKTSSINRVLYRLRDTGQIELVADGKSNRVRLTSSPIGEPCQPSNYSTPVIPESFPDSPYTAHSKLTSIFADLLKGLPKDEIEKRALSLGLDPEFTRSRIVNDGRGLRGWKWQLREADGKEFIEITARPNTVPD